MKRRSFVIFVGFSFIQSTRMSTIVCDISHSSSMEMISHFIFPELILVSYYLGVLCYLEKRKESTYCDFHDCKVLLDDADHFTHNNPNWTSQNSYRIGRRRPWIVWDLNFTSTARPKYFNFICNRCLSTQCKRQKRKKQQQNTEVSFRFGQIVWADCWTAFTLQAQRYQFDTKPFRFSYYVCAQMQIVV